MTPGQLITRRYRVESLLGAGGLGAAYLVLDRARDQRVCLKLLAHHELSRALRSEFEALRLVSHPNLARVRDFGVALLAGVSTPFFTSDLIEGRPLDVALAGMPFEVTRDTIGGVLSALASLHASGVRHGDIKPENILVSPQGRAVVIDLSCTATIGDAVAPAGTPGFMAPEVLRGEQADGRADLFSLGRVLQPLIGGSDVPPPARALVRRMLAEHASDRPLSAVEALEELTPGFATVVAPHATPRTLIDRRDLLTQTTAAIRALAEGRPGPRVLDLIGPRGSGKTRFLRELAWSAQQVCSTVEVFVHRPEAVTRALAIASDREELPAGVLAAVAAHEALVSEARPLVIVVDDADRTNEEELAILDTFARLLAPSDPILLVRAGTRPRGTVAVELKLEPLSEAGVRDWAAEVGFSEAHGRIYQATRGHPADVDAAVAALERGVPARGLETALEVEPGELQALPADSQLALALIACARAPLELDTLAVLDPSASPAAIAALEALGVVRLTAAGLELLRPGLEQAVLHAIPAETFREAHRLLGERAEAAIAGERIERASEAAAAATRHFALGGCELRAASLFERSLALMEAAPLAWRAAVEPLLAEGASDAMVLALARALLGAGDARAALELVSSRAGDEAALLRAECEIELGEAKLARDLLVTIEPADHVLSARRAALLSRALVRLGAFGDAHHASLPAILDSSLPPSVRADLLECAGVAALYSGDPARAKGWLDEAEALLGTFASPRRRVRAAAHRGIAAFRAGDLEAARRGYGDALALAEKHALADQIARSAVNFGTACHQRGEVAEAQAAYARGEQIARALDQRDSLLVLAFNAAKLYADAGALDRAEAKAQQVVTAGERQQKRFFVAAAQSVLGDVAFARGDLERARRLFEASRTAFVAEDAKREIAEEELELGRVAISAGRDGDAAAHLAAARALGLDDAADLRVRAAMLSARLALGTGDAAAARRELSGALRDAEEAGLPELRARALMLLADATSMAGLAGEAAEHRARARAIWTSMTLGLGEAEVAAFFRRPERAALTAEAPSPVGGQPSSHPRSELYERLVASFRKLNASLETEDVLRMALDEAIELTGAERGFLLLAAPASGELSVAVARNLDKASLDEGHMRFSRSIAERAIRSAEPVLTVDAQSDDRFRSNVSVHAMGLRSVIAVPIRSPDGVLGALYLDNRYKRARFGDADSDVLLSFADQVAIALRNARLAEALAHRGERLEREGEALRDELEKTRAALEHRFDYSAMIGRSAALRRVLSVLDRVIDSPLSVLVSGESGTGKELVARAIHAGSQRRAAPFVGINCAALPAALLESELFGHARGAFTGADRDRAGLVVAAKGGTLFLDELGEMPLEVQAKLLRVLQEREVRPLGSSVTVPVDFRLVCATNRDLRKEAAAGRFREDLYYRVGVVEVTVPPLRERLDDLPDLVRHFVTKSATELGRPLPKVTLGVLRKLEQHDFPGNVRELENLITKAVVLADGDELRAADIELPRAAKLPKKRSPANEREVLLRALEASNYSAVRAASDLGMPRATFYRKLKACGLERPVRSRRA